MNTLEAQAIEVRKMFEKLDETLVGDVVTYKELSEIIGKDVTKHRHMLDKARAFALERQKVFGVVRGVGLRRLTDIETVQTGQRTMHSVRGAVHRGMNRITKVDFNELPKDVKQQHNVYYSVFGAISALTHKKKLDKVHERVAKAETSLKLKELLESVA